MAVYVGTVLLVLLILVLFYLLIVFSTTRMSPKVFLRQARDVQILAFSTSSSAAVMPLTIKTAEERFKVRPSVSQFLIPLGATINMDGTALYQGAATIFLGIPASGIALIIGVDRILDMSRTAVNVTGDLTASLVMDRWTDKNTT